MPHPCPRPCGRLATAAVFVSISVVQFIAGLILLNSRYMYLLSGPDFWTAASNLAVGVLLGMSASVWKDIQKPLFKHIIRRNLLASLVASAITINSTTAIILILGEGNALLSIQLESDGKYSSKSEILAYSYAASVCSPIISVVVAIVFLSGMWFRVSDKGMKTPEFKSISKKDSIDDYNWVFKEKLSPSKRYSNIVRKDLSFKSLSSSSDDESFSLTDPELWSNSVHSIEYLNSSRKGTCKTGKHRNSKDWPELTCKSGEHLKNTPGKFSYGTSRVSFVDDSKTIKSLKFSPHTYRRHLENYSPFYPDEIVTRDINKGSLSYDEFKKMPSRKMTNQSHKKKRMLLMVQRAVQEFKHNEGSIKCGSPEVYIPRAHTRKISESKLSTTSDVKAEVHVDPKIQEWILDENSSESPVLHCEDVPTCDFSTEILPKNAKFQSVSTSKQLNKSDASQPKGSDSIAREVCRTSTSAGTSSSNILHLDISDIQTDSVIDQNESYELEEEKDTSDVASPQSAASQVNSNIEVDDSFIDVPQPNVLAGEVVKVQVNSLPRTPFHSKLIPVAIPVISSVKKKSLKRRNEDPFTVGIDDFSGRNKLGFSSFHGKPKTINQSSHHIKADGENITDQKSETVNERTICEMSPDHNLLPSPAQTSGYDSAIFENTHLSDSECFNPNLSSLVTHSPYYTPKKKFRNFRSPRNLNNMQ